MCHEIHAPNSSVPVHVVLGDEEQQPEGRDERARERVHHRHAEEEHHPGVLLTEAKLVLDGRADGGGVGNGLTQAGLKKWEKLNLR